MSESGRIRETYHAAIQHDIIELSGDEHMAGVVRRPTGWFRNVIESNYPELGPPESLLEETKAKQEELAVAGMCDTGAHNAAWEETNFEGRFRDYIESCEAADEALDSLAIRVTNGETVVLTCFESEDKRCHRHILKEILEDRIA